MKKVMYTLPFDLRKFVVSGSPNDQSILQPLEIHGCIEPHILHLCKQVVAPHFTCIDIGANIGCISLALSHLVPSGKVYAFEPSSDNFQYLSINMTENGITNMIPLQIGVFDQTGKATFSNVAHGGGWAHMTHEITHGLEETISTVRLDDWVKDNGIPSVDFIKMDIEGAESRALDGMRDTITRFKPDMVMEFNVPACTGLFGEQPEALYAKLRSLYPNIYTIHCDRLEGPSYVLPVTSYEELFGRIHNGILIDVYCTYKG